jgi:hypothetical protein
MAFHNFSYHTESRAFFKSTNTNRNSLFYLVHLSKSSQYKYPIHTPWSLNKAVVGLEAIQEETIPTRPQIKPICISCIFPYSFI